MKTPLPQARILPMRFLTVCKVTATFDPHFENDQKKRLPLLTPTDDHENNDYYYRSDAPCREISSFLRLRRCRGMRHTGTFGIALTGCVAHRSKQGKNIFFPAASRRSGSLSGGVPPPETPGENEKYFSRVKKMWYNKLKRKYEGR